MNVTSAVLTVIHVVIAFTPLYGWIARQVLGVPDAIIEPGRIGLMIMTPWTWSIAYRRFNQGVLIRFDHSRAVGIGTIVRLSTDLIVLGIGYFARDIPGIIVASSAVAAGVLSEAVFVGILVQPVLKNQLRTAPPVHDPITLRSFLDFYTPLAMTSLLGLIVQPIGSAALSRMPLPIESLAAWPVINGLAFMFRALGIAYNEAVVALLDEPQAYLSLRRFTRNLTIFTTALLFVMNATPLASIWFGKVSGLSPRLTELAIHGLWIVLPTPALAVLQSWLQGAILHGRKTRGITESVILYLGVCIVLFGIGVAWQGLPGLYIALFVFTIAMAIQTIWLWRANRSIMHQLASPIPAKN